MIDEKIKILIMDSILLFNSIFCLNSSVKIQWNKLPHTKNVKELNSRGQGYLPPFFVQFNLTKEEPNG